MTSTPGEECYDTDTAGTDDARYVSIGYFEAAIDQVLRQRA